MAFLDGFPDNTVKRFNRIGGVNRLADVLGIVEQRIQVLPVAAPAFTDLRVFTVPSLEEGVQRLERFRVVSYS